MSKKIFEYDKLYAEYGKERVDDMLQWSKKVTNGIKKSQNNTAKQLSEYIQNNTLSEDDKKIIQDLIDKDSVYGKYIK